MCDFPTTVKMGLILRNNGRFATNDQHIFGVGKFCRFGKVERAGFQCVAIYYHYFVMLDVVVAIQLHIDPIRGSESDGLLADLALISFFIDNRPNNNAPLFGIYQGLNIVLWNGKSKVM